MKRNLFLTAIIFILSLTILNAQSWQWGKNGGGSTSAGTADNTILDMKIDKQGNTYVLGLVTRTTARFMGDTFTINGPNDLLLYKVDCNGNKLWHKQIGDMSAIDGEQKIVLDKDDNVYLIGNSVPASSHAYVIDIDTTFTPPMSTRFNGNIIKFDKNGNFIYYKTNQLANAIGYNLGYRESVFDENNNLYIISFVRGNLGFINRSDTTTTQDFVLKYDANAVLQSYFPLSDSGFINTWSIACDKKGNLYVSGYTSPVGLSSKVSIHGGHQITASSAYICKFDTSGTLKWITENEDSTTFIYQIKYNDQSNRVEMAGAGGGHAPGPGTKFDTLILANPLDINNAPIVVLFDTLGNPIRGAIVGCTNSMVAYTIDHSNANTIAIGGVVAGHTSFGSQDIPTTNGQDAFFAELTPDLQFIHGEVIEGTGFYDAVTNIAYDERGNIRIGGFMGGDLNIPGDTLTKMPGGISNLFILKYGVTTCICPYAVSNYSDAYTSSLTYTYTSSALNADTIWWSFGDGNTQSGGTTANHTYATAGNYTVCQHVSNVCSIDEYCKNIDVVTSINEVKESYSVIIYPNPASTTIQIHIQEGDLPENSEYILFDIAGKKVLGGKMNGQDTSILIPFITNGVYLLQVNNSEGMMILSKRVEVLK